MSIVGTSGDDILSGNDAKNTIKGLDGNDQLNGFGGDDKLLGGSGDDSLYGGTGDDRLIGGDGNDFLYGQDGDDFIDPGNNNYFDWIDTGAGNDTIDFSGVTDSAAFFNIAHDGLSAGITVSIDGTANTGTIDKGVNGTTTVIGVSTAVEANGFRIYGTAYDDVFHITPGDSGLIQVFSSAGNDTIDIGAGSGGFRLDFRGVSTGISVDLDAGKVWADGFGGVDTITGPGHVTSVRGSSFNDIIFGSGTTRSEIFYGRAGNDYIKPGGNTFFDDIHAGSGADTIDFSNVAKGVSFFNIIHDDLSGNISVSIDGVANTGIIDKGGDGTTTLVDISKALSNGYGMRVYGTDFGDTYQINPGDSGFIEIASSGGNDTINIAASTGGVDLDFRAAAGGIDVNLTTGVVARDGYGGRDTITGPGHVTRLDGSTFGDVIVGSDNAELFTLRGGSDTLDGGGGIDQLDFFLDEAAGATFSAIVVDLGAGTATGNRNGVAFSASISNIEKVSGSDAADDTFIGSDVKKEIMNGGGGDDSLSGLGGKDKLKGDAGNDTLDGGEGRDTLKGGDGDDLLRGGKGTDQLNGGGGSDSLIGGNGDDQLKGGAGRDNLDGRNGDDQMSGGGGGDTFVFSDGADVVTDFDVANGHEWIDLSGVSAFTDFAALTAGHLNDVGGHAVIDDGNGNTLDLLGVSVSDLSADNFIF